MVKKILLVVLAIIVVIVVIPALVLLIHNGKPDQVKITAIEKAIRVFNHNTNQLMEMDLDEYIIGVVAEEMPASFEIEALKAQAIAARTYAYKRILEPDDRIKKLHPEADVVTDSTICQAWVSDNQMKEKWGTVNYLLYKNKISNAVNATKGQVIVYDHKLIDPVYHASTGGGKTENSEDVWASPLPYLVSVQCPDHKDRHYEDTKTIPFLNVDTALGTNLQGVPVSTLRNNSNSYIEVLERTSAGRIKTIKIGNQTLKATELRVRLGLKSTWFTWKIEDDAITFITRGYGHGVGMCQYGANQLAQEGKTYEEILKHYYTGVELISAY